MPEYIGRVVKHVVTKDGQKYAILKFKNHANLNFKDHLHLLPDSDLPIGSKVKVILSILPV